MRQQVIITILLTLILCIAIGLKLIFFPVTQGNAGFYFHSTFWICGVCITVITLNMLWHLVSPKNTAKRHKPHAFWPNRRKTFRIIYPAFVQPKLIVEQSDGNQRRQLEFPIVDLSQEGSCFIDDGSLGELKTFSGIIRFHGGDTIRIGGDLIRKVGDHVSVRFHQAIEWPTLLEEQRRLMVHTKLKPRQLTW